jgi:uncharacterized protein (TIGR03086 family)
MHVTELHRRSVEEFARRLDALASLTDEDWHRPTPCSEWDVRALLNHVVYEDLWTVPLMEGATLEEVGDRFEGDLLGDGTASALAVARSACDAATMAAASGVVAGNTVHLSFGDAPAEEYAYQLAADHLIHGWDLSAATGGDRTIDPELVAACAEWFAGREDQYRSAGAIAPRPGVEPPAGDAQAELLVAFGRDPGWTPG